MIDEADRLLAQSFQDWLAQVLAATRPPAISESSAAAPAPASLNSVDVPASDAVAPAYRHLVRGIPHVHTDLDEKKESSCQKLLFSATLTRDPAKISALHLNNPQYLVVQSTDDKTTKEDGVLDLVMEKFAFPASLSVSVFQFFAFGTFSDTLQEHMVVCDSSQKPLMLFHLVHTHNVTNAIVFTKSAESTNRLVRLFDFFESIRASESETSYQPKTLQAYSSELSAGDRKVILERFKHQEINMYVPSQMNILLLNDTTFYSLVCSDLISRGIDISHVSHVVSYDAPVDMRKYVHRVGRTARAGRAGDAWTLVEEQEVRHQLRCEYPIR